MAKRFAFPRVLLVLMLVLGLTGNGWAALTGHVCCPAGEGTPVVARAEGGLPCHGAATGRAGASSAHAADAGRIAGLPHPANAPAAAPASGHGGPGPGDSGCHPDLACAQCVGLPATGSLAPPALAPAASPVVPVPVAGLVSAPRAPLWRPPILA